MILPLRLLNSFFLLTVFFVMGCVYTVYADTVLMHDGSEVKGIVVEDFHDRIIISTYEGEKEFLKESIKDIRYDTPEQNFVKLGDFHESRGNYIKAYTYFKKAHEINADYKIAEERFVHIRSRLLRRPDVQLKDEMDRKKALFMASGKVYEQKEISEPDNVVLEQRLRQMTGLVLDYDFERAMFKVKEVVAASPAFKAEIKKNDYVYAIWGRMAGYMEFKDLAVTMLDNPTPEVSLSVIRQIYVNQKNESDPGYGGIADLGFFVNMSHDGLVVSDVKSKSLSEKAGLKKSDQVVAINTNPTRYLPLKDSLSLILEGLMRDKSVCLEVVRRTAFWRKEL
ncbi:MAG: hypothetical protein ABIB11_00070 [Candidatus Omnitrophota bacterium]